MIPLNAIQINGKLLVIEDIEEFSIHDVPGFQGWRRTYGIDRDLGLHLVGYVNDELAKDVIVSLSLYNAGDAVVEVQALTTDTLLLDPKSGVRWRNPNYALGVASPKAGHPSADKWMNQQYVDIKATEAPGSANMDFHHPMEAWYDWWGLSHALADRLERYLDFTERRPRHWLADLSEPYAMHHIPRLAGGKGNPTSPEWGGFGETMKNIYGYSHGDQQHADMLELFLGVKILNHPAYFEAALKFWGNLWRNGWETDPNYLLKRLALPSESYVIHSPRTFGWSVFHNSGRMLSMLADRGPVYDWIRDQIVEWIDWQLGLFTQAFPDRIHSPSSWSLNTGIQKYGVNFVSDWQLCSTIPWGLQECEIGLKAQAQLLRPENPDRAVYEGLAARCHQMAEDVLDFAETTAFDFNAGALHHFRTIDDVVKVPGGVPGIGNWGIAAGLRSPKGQDRSWVERSIEQIFKSPAYGNYNPLNTFAIGMMRPLVEKENGLSTEVPKL